MALVVIVTDRHKRYKVKVSKNPFLIGRSSRTNLQVSDELVSGQHLSLALESDRVIIKDLDSTNGTLINNTKLNEAALMLGDIVFIGKIKLHLDPRSMTTEEKKAHTKPTKNTTQVSFIDLPSLTNADDNLKVIKKTGKIKDNNAFEERSIVVDFDNPENSYQVKNKSQILKEVSQTVHNSEEVKERDDSYPDIDIQTSAEFTRVENESQSKISSTNLMSNSKNELSLQKKGSSSSQYKEKTAIKNTNIASITKDKTSLKNIDEIIKSSTQLKEEEAGSSSTANLESHPKINKTHSKGTRKKQSKNKNKDHTGLLNNLISKIKNFF